MEFQDVVRKRRTVRAFERRELPREFVEQIIKNSQRGPSSGFTQGFDFLVFDGYDMTKKFWDHIISQTGENFDQKNSSGETAAPLIIVPLANSKAYVARYLEPDKVQVGRKTETDWPSPYWIVDSSFASMLIILSAVNLGLGVFYFSIGPTSKSIPPFREAFGIPEQYFPIGAIAIGYPAPSAPSQSLRRGRRQRSEVFHYGHW
jgi:nitroreductase